MKIDYNFGAGVSKVDSSQRSDRMNSIMADDATLKSCEKMIVCLVDLGVFSTGGEWLCGR
jgi:hypothetical protein